MSIIVEPDRILLSGALSVEDAEPLLAALLDHPDLPIDVSALASAHLAVVQLLLASRQRLIGLGDSPLLARLPIGSMTLLSA